jgi:hypothetical protein
MKVILLYRPDSEHAETVEEFARDFVKQHADRRIELLSVDTREGSSMAMLYDIVSYPAILALSDDGLLLQNWQGSTMPLMDEVAYYAHS